MADPAVLSSLVTGTTAVLSGFVGYGTARGQRLVEIRRLEREDREAFAAREDILLRERQAVYFEYMEVLDRFSDLATRKSGLDPGEMDAWWAEFQTADTKVEVLGSETTRAATNPVHSTLHEAYGAINWDAEDFAASALAAHDQYSNELEKVRKAFVDAVRADLHSRGASDR